MQKSKLNNLKNINVPYNLTVNGLIFSNNLFRLKSEFGYFIAISLKISGPFVP